MPKRKKPRAVKRVRKSPYDRTLEHAINRLAKLENEHDECQARLFTLNQEIPYLKEVIRVLSPPTGVKPTNQAWHDNRIAEAGLTNAVADQDAFLARFIKPRDNGNVAITITQPPPREPQSEEETLPPIQGEPLLE